MGTNILGIGQSGLAAAQLGIATTGHNIANANSPGYSRQVLFQSAAPSRADGGNFIGQGAKVGEIRRIYNQLVGQQVNSTQSTKSYAETYSLQIQQINNLVADPTTGVSPGIQDFFSSIQNLAASPNGTAGAAARQSVLSAGASLSSKIKSLGAKVDQIADDVNSRIGQSVTSINLYAQQISDLNTAIGRAQSTSDGAQPNDLLDQRDLAVRELSKYVNVSVVEQDNKYNIFMGTGQPLIVGASVSKLQQINSLTDPTRTQIAYESNGALVSLNEKSLGGGRVGWFVGISFQYLGRDAQFSWSSSGLNRDRIQCAAPYGARSKWYARRRFLPSRLASWFSKQCKYKLSKYCCVVF
jgi:flagellar hook-associated protein 1 FlgK